MEENKNTAISIIDAEQVGLIINGAPEVLAANKLSVERASKDGVFLLDTIEGNGMNDELDGKVNDYLVKIKRTLAVLNDRRKPITQIIDLIRTEFTALESKLDPKDKTSIYFRLQQKRNDYVTLKASEQRKKEEEANQKLKADKERGSVKAEIEKQIRDRFINYKADEIAKINSLFAMITLENFDETKNAIEYFAIVYPYAVFDQFTPSIRSSFDRNEVSAMIVTAKAGKYDGYAVEFKAELQAAKDSIKDRLHSRRFELDAIAAEVKRNADKAAEMQKAAADRATADAKRLEAERVASLNKSAATAETSRQVDFTESLFTSQELISSAPAQTAKTRESYEIEVTNPLGYLLIVQFYFEHEGKTETVEALENKKLGAMKKFCEKYAFKNDVKIDSPFLKYVEKTKAIAAK